MLIDHLLQTRTAAVRCGTRVQETIDRLQSRCRRQHVHIKALQKEAKAGRAEKQRAEASRLLAGRLDRRCRAQLGNMQALHNNLHAAGEAIAAKDELIARLREAATADRARLVDARQQLDKAVRHAERMRLEVELMAVSVCINKAVLAGSLCEPPCNHF